MSYVFRGVSDSGYGLATAFERNFAGHYWKEEEIINAFRTRMHQFLDPSEIPQSILEHLAVMQHHGIPTRLLDFTRSEYVAAYFAAKDMSDYKDGAIYAINLSNLLLGCNKVLHREGIGIPLKLMSVDDYIQHGTRIFSDDMFDELVKPNRVSLVLPVEPFKQNLRLSKQQGVFLFASKLNQPFEATLKEVMSCYVSWTDLQTLKGDMTLMKFIIPAEEKKRIMKELRRMNLTGETIFGGLDGFSSSVKEAAQFSDS